MSEYQIHTSLDNSCTNTHVAFPKVRKYSVPRCSEGKYPGPKSIPVVGPANQCGRSPQQFRIPAGPRSLAVRAQIWVAIEVSGHRCPNDRYGVRSRRHGRVWWVQTRVRGPLRNPGSPPGRVHWRSVREIGWPWKYLAIKVQTAVTACVRDATGGCGGCKSMSGAPPAIPDPCRAAFTGDPCADLGGHRSIWP